MFDLRKSLLVGIGPPFDIFDDTQRTDKLEIQTRSVTKWRTLSSLNVVKTKLLEGLTFDGTKFSVGLQFWETPMTSHENR